MSEKLIRIASRLYEARDAVRVMCRDNFAAVMVEQKGFIREVMEANKCEALPATMAIVTELQKRDPWGRESANAQTLILAAYVEMEEPTEEAAAA